MTEQAAYPFSLEAEMSVLGGVLIDPDRYTEVSERLNPTMFLDPRSRAVFAAAGRICDRGSALDAVTLLSELDRGGESRHASFVADLFDAVPTAANIMYHVGVVYDKYRLRGVLDTAKAMKERALAPGNDSVDSIVAEASSSLGNHLLDGDGDGLRPVVASHFEEEKMPEKVIWRDGDSGAVLREGEVAFLSGQGGDGKSYLSLALAWASATFQGDVCGLGVRSGRVVVMSYEDGGKTVWWRLGMIAGRKGRPPPYVPLDTPDNVLVVPNPQPLWVMEDRKTRKSDTWDKQWSMIHSLEPSLVIIDPLVSAAPIEAVDNTGARAFVQALMAEGKEGGWGTLVVAHSNKMARFNTADPGPGCISGAGQYYDSARGVLYVFRHGPDLMMVCPKANNGPQGWGVLMEKDMRKPRSEDRKPRFAGWLRKESLTRSEVKDKLKGGKK